MFLIVPNVLADAIDAKLDAALAECPEAEKHRDVWFKELLNYFNEHGEIPDCQIVKKDGATL